MPSDRSSPHTTSASGSPDTTVRTTGSPASTRRRLLVPVKLGGVTMEGDVPTLADVLEARRRIAPHLSPTPLYAYPGLGELVGTEVHVKHENHLPTGAFKVRGGV